MDTDKLSLIAKIFGKGNGTVEDLRKEGFDSLEKIAEADPKFISQTFDLSEEMSDEVVQLAAELLAESNGAPEDEGNLSEIKGVGQSTSKKLREAGYETVESVALAGPEAISKTCQMPLSMCSKIVAEARKIIMELKPDDSDAVTAVSAPFEEARLYPADQEENVIETVEKRGIETRKSADGGTNDAKKTTESKRVQRISAFKRYLAKLIAKELMD